MTPGESHNEGYQFYCSIFMSFSKKARKYGFATYRIVKLLRLRQAGANTETSRVFAARIHNALM